MAKIQEVEKKKKAGGCLVWCAVVLLVLLVGTFVSGYFNSFYAWGAKQKLEDVTIEAELLENGDLRITETWVLAMKSRGTPYKNGYKSFSAGGYSGVEDLTVYDHDMDITYTLLEDVENPEKGDYPANSSYIATKTDHRDEITEYEVGWFFEPISSGVRTFTFSYTMSDIATVYNDTAELYVGFIGSNFSVPIQNLSITLRLPEGQSENPLVWLHSASNGIIQIADASTVTVEASNVNAQTMVECRILLDKQSLPASASREEVDKKEAIRAEERGWFAESDALRRYSATIVLAGFLLIVLSFLFWDVFAKANRHKVEVPDYVREVPNMSPGAASVLYRFYDDSPVSTMNVNGKLISALVLSMVQKGWLVVQTTGEGKKAETRLTPLANGHAPLSYEEQPLYTIFTTLAAEHGGSFTMQQYAAYGREEFTKVDSAMGSISAAMRSSFNAHGWVEKGHYFRRPSTWIGFAMLLFAMVSMGLAYFNSLFGLLVFCFGISALLWLANGFFDRRLTPEGETAYQSLKALRKYLINFTVMNERAPAEVHLWQEYMIFATLMGCADSVRKNMPFPGSRAKEPAAPSVGIPAQPYAPGGYSPSRSSHWDDDYSNNSWNDSSSGGNSFNAFSALGDAVSQTFQGVQNAASNLARPSGGGSGGGGGGSSSGGGGGGGSSGGGGVR